ncbi:MAG: TVP38/TMEM64 family protein [Thermodesulfobacteriota bacterium]
MIPIAVMVLIVATLASMWRFTPLQQYTDPETLKSLISMVRAQWWTPLAVIPAYLAANSLMFPNMVLNGAVILTLGGLLGWACAVGGSLTAASVFFFLGYRFGTGKLDFIRGERFEKVRQFLRKGGIGAVVAVRMLPMAPYAVVNTAAGTIDLRFRDFIIGTFIAHLPGTLTLAVFGEQLETAIMDPSAKNITILATVLLLGIGVVWIVKRYARKHANV